MSRATLYITNLLPEPVMAALRDRYTLACEPSETQFPTNDDRRQGFAQADAVICTLADPITDDLSQLWNPRENPFSTEAAGCCCGRSSCCC